MFSRLVVSRGATVKSHCSHVLTSHGSLWVKQHAAFWVERSHSGGIWGGGEMIGEYDGLVDLSMNRDVVECCRDMMVTVQWWFFLLSCKDHIGPDRARGRRREDWLLRSSTSPWEHSVFYYIHHHHTDQTTSNWPIRSRKRGRLGRLLLWMSRQRHLHSLLEVATYCST